MSKLSMYGYYLMNFITGGSKSKKGELAADSISTRYGKVYTRRYTRKIYVIRKFPTLDLGNPVCRILRNELRTKFRGLEVIIHMDCTPLNINIKDQVYIRRYGKAERDYRIYEQEFSTMSNTERVVGRQYRTSKGGKFIVTKKQLDKYRDVFRSYEYVTDSIQNGTSKFFNTMYFIELLIPNGMQEEYITQELMNICDSLGLIVNPIEGATNKFFSNLSLTAIKKTQKLFPSMIFSSENLALNSSYKSPGLVGGDGVLLGLDKFSCLPYMPNFFNSGGAKVAMVIGESGSGKTYLAFYLCAQFIADGIHCSVLDIKGGEWRALGALSIPYLEIDMSSQNNTFVNLLRLDDMVKADLTKQEVLELYDLAVTGTTKLFMTMVNIQPNEGNPVDVSRIIRTAVEKVYNNINGFKPNKKETFALTKNLAYEDVINVIRGLARNYTATGKEDVGNYDVNAAKLCRLIVNRCETFVTRFSSVGDSSVREITTADVLDTPLIIYNMNKNQDTQGSIEDTVKVFMIQYLDIKKQFFRKKRGLHTVAFYEELQRCGNMKSMVEYISAMVTGGRSNNLAVFMLLNSIRTFDQKDFAAIKSNITLYMAGKMKTKDVDKLIEDFDCSDIAHLLDMVNPRKKQAINNLRNKEEFGNSFVVKFRRGETEYDRTICKVELPNKLCSAFETAKKRK